MWLQSLRSYFQFITFRPDPLTLVQVFNERPASFPPVFYATQGARAEARTRARFVKRTHPQMFTLYDFIGRCQSSRSAGLCLVSMLDRSYKVYLGLFFARSVHVPHTFRCCLTQPRQPLFSLRAIHCNLCHNSKWKSFRSNLSYWEWVVHSRDQYT